MIEHELQKLIARYIANQMARGDFSEEFAALYVRARNDRNASPELRSLCNALSGPFAEWSGGFRGEESFRKELIRLASPLGRVLSSLRNTGTTTVVLMRLQIPTPRYVASSMNAESATVERFPELAGQQG